MQVRQGYKLSEALTQRVKELAEKVEQLEAKVNGHLERMGFKW